MVVEAAVWYSLIEVERVGDPLAESEYMGESLIEMEWVGDPLNDEE